MEKLGATHSHVETLSTPPLSGHDAERQHHNDAVSAPMELDENSLPPGYFKSKFFIGSMAGIGLGLMAGVGTY